MKVPRPRAMLRMVAFAVAAGLAMAGVQPVVASLAGAVPIRWAIGLTAPAVLAAALVFGAARASDRGDSLQPPWYAAWIMLPGAFLLAGAAAMCIFGALIQIPAIAWTLWTLLIGGCALWMSAMVLVRSCSR